MSINLCRKRKLLNRCNRKPPSPREGDRTGFSNDAKHRLGFSDCGGRSFHAFTNYYKKVSCCWVNSFRHLLRLKLRKCHLSLRLGHARGLTAHRAVIQYPRAASLPREGGLSCFFDSLKQIRIIRICLLFWRICRCAHRSSLSNALFTPFSAPFAPRQSISAGRARTTKTNRADRSAPKRCRISRCNPKRASRVCG